ncbi:hypothetical protein BT67DRAFT_79800 [Trichocladium antarcticum]|uniref:Uncharacterized protein n=1 Tax=Trichocladium antarcticum TaxID=1450529 RepID=A0AAN6ZCL7_9PEZI|nr:hypothetical protein BT67DRAFT_79800 [Trichocladium antarcticum]
MLRLLTLEPDPCEPWCIFPPSCNRSFEESQRRHVGDLFFVRLVSGHCCTCCISLVVAWHWLWGCRGDPCWWYTAILALRSLVFAAACTYSNY